MGWDCVAVGSLYNKMRVKKDLAKELLDLFLKYADVTATSLKAASHILDLEEAKNADLRRSVDVAERSLKDAKEFVDRGYSAAREGALKNISKFNDQVSRLNTQIDESEKAAAQLAAKLLDLPDQITREVTSSVCDFAPPGATALCHDLVDTIVVENPAKVAAKRALSDAQNQTTQLRDTALKDAQQKLEKSTAQLADLDEKVLRVKGAIEDGTLETTAAAARDALAAAAVVLADAKKKVSDARRIDRLVNQTIAVWNDGAKPSAVLADFATTAAAVENEGQVLPDEYCPSLNSPSVALVSTDSPLLSIDAAVRAHLDRTQLHSATVSTGNVKVHLSDDGGPNATYLAMESDISWCDGDVLLKRDLLLRDGMVMGI